MNVWAFYIYKPKKKKRKRVIDAPPSYGRALAPEKISMSDYELFNELQKTCPIDVNFLWQGESGNNWTLDGTKFSASGWMMRHSDGTISVRDRTASVWNNHVFPKSVAVYTIPSSVAGIFKLGQLINYVKTEGCVNYLFGVHRIIEMKRIPKKGGRFVVELVMTFVKMESPNFTALSAKRSRSESDHFEILKETLLPLSANIKIKYENITLHSSSWSSWSYTPDFCISITKNGVPNNILVESKSNYESFYEAGMLEKLNLCNENNFELLLVFGTKPSFIFFDFRKPFSEQRISSAQETIEKFKNFTL